MAADYLTTADLRGLHVIKRYEGLLGVCAPGALEAAIYRPPSGYYKDLIQEASALMESKVKQTVSRWQQAYCFCCDGCVFAHHWLANQLWTHDHLFGNDAAFRGR